jgi:bacteriorhodopsin
MERISIEVFEIVSHVLTLGFAAMGAALLYFILTKNDNSPKYRPSSVLSVVVMVSAFLLLFLQYLSWNDAYVLEASGAAYVLAEETRLFTNGFRYLNWLIDVPMLLIQILFVAGITGAAFTKYLRNFAVSGVLMILTGYVGQFYEPGRAVVENGVVVSNDGNLGLWLLWGFISTVFYIFVLVFITRVIKEGSANMKKSKARPIFEFILPLFYVAWTIYPVAYVMPAFIEQLGYGAAIASQQVLYTIADIASKVVYGVLLNIASTILSNEQGYEGA